MGCVTATAKRRRRQARLLKRKKVHRGNLKPHLLSQRLKGEQSIWPQYNRNK